MRSGVRRYRLKVVCDARIVDAEAQALRHSEGYASTPWNPPRRGTRPTVDAGESPSPPSSSRSGDPTRRGSAVRCRYLYKPSGGLRRRKVRSAPLPPCGERFSHSLAPPFRTRSASLGSRPRRGQQSARMTADFENTSSLPRRNHSGDSSVASLPLNDGNDLYPAPSERQQIIE